MARLFGPGGRRLALPYRVSAIQCNDDSNFVTQAPDSVILPNPMISNNKTAVTNLITLFPNPAKNRVYLNIPSEIKEFEWQLTNLSGQICLKGKQSSANKSISFNDQREGLYLFKVQSGQRVYYTKLIIEP